MDKEKLTKEQIEKLKQEKVNKVANQQLIKK